MAKYIDAEGVMRACYDSFLKTGNKAYREIFALAEAVPTADVAEVRHGRWKPFDLAWGRSIYTCTACGDAFEVPTEYGSGKPMYEFCPYCGAKMDEVEE